MARSAARIRIGVALLCCALAGCEYDLAPVQPAQTRQLPQPGEYVLVRVSSRALPYPFSVGSASSTALLDDTITLGQAHDVRQVWRIRHTTGPGPGADGDSTSTITRLGSYVDGSDQRGPVIEIRGALYTSPLAGPPSQWADSPVMAVASESGITVYAPSRWRNWELDLWEYRKLVVTPEGIDH